MSDFESIESSTVSSEECPTLTCAFKPENTEAVIDKHIIIFHGWNSNSSDMTRMRDAIRQLKGANKRYIWLVSFETSRLGFDKAAQFLKHELDKQPFDFSDTIYFGYSLGGLVARQLVADGMQCTALIALCSPHDGILDHIPQLPWDKSERSMRKNSTELNALNSNQRDIDHHNRYYFFGMGFINQQNEKEHHDKLISLRSTLGNNLTNLQYTFAIYINHDYNFFDFHHLKGMDPHYCQDVLATLERILHYVDV